MMVILIEHNEKANELIRAGSAAEAITIDCLRSFSAFKYGLKQWIT